MDLVLLKIRAHVMRDHKANGSKILQYCALLPPTLHSSKVTVFL